MSFSSFGSCSAVECYENNCLIQRDYFTGKPARLPACSNHRAKIHEIHSIYKKYSEFNIQLKTRLGNFQGENRLNLLKVYQQSLESEINLRIKATKAIKSEYQDAGHLFYLNGLIGNYSQILKELEGNLIR